MPVAPSRPKGPPLNALRAFEAAARLGGFAAAAEELCVTAGAVAQHIKALEDWADAPLFQRRSQGVVLTPLGSEVASEFEDAFDRLGSAVQALRVRALPQDVRIATLPSIAQLWLSPRLPALRQALPGAILSVTVLERAPNLQREPFDLSLFFTVQPEGDAAVAICDEEIFPVCTPDLAETIARPADLKDVPCLSDVSWADDWDRWSDAIHPEDRFKPKGPSFSLYSLAIEECCRGAGILMGHAPLVDSLVEDGVLTAPFPERLRTGRTLTLTSSSSFARSSTYAPVVAVLMPRWAGAQ